MRQLNFNDSGPLFARGALFLTAVSMFSLHAIAQNSDSQKPLPGPIFSALPVPTVDSKLTKDNLTPPSPATAAAPLGNRMTGFAAPAETASTSSKPNLPSPTLRLSDLPVPVAPVAITAQVAPQVAPTPVPGATSRAGIRRLGQERSPAASSQHPLAAAYPGFDVIVCIAGCGSEPRAVSIYQPKQRLQQFAAMDSGFIQAAMVTTSYNADTAPNPLLHNITTECLAGCYDSAPRVRAVAPTSVPAAVPSRNAPVGATDRAVSAPTSTVMKAVSQHLKPKARNRTGSDWFTRRFSTQTPTHNQSQ